MKDIGLKNFLAGFYVSILTFFSAILIQIFINAAYNKEQEVYEIVDHDFYLFVFFSPVIESFIAIIVLKLCLIFMRKSYSCVVLGFFWASLHSAAISDVYSIFGLWLVSFISFYLYGWLYFECCRSKFFISVFIIAFPHFLHNLYVYLLLFYLK